jgi:hypothetical protein
MTDSFFATDASEPPMDAPLAPEGDFTGEEPNDGGFTFLGDAPPAEAASPFVGDVNEAPPAEMGFADAPAEMGFADAPVDAFSAPQAETGYDETGGYDQTGGYDDTGGYDESGGYDAFSAPPAEDAPIILAPPSEDEICVETAEPPEPAEPSPMQKWNAEWLETLAARKDEENAKKAEMVEGARATKELFQKDREIKRDAKMSKNREDEQIKLEAIEADLENDNSWQRVCKMVELSHDGVDDSEDVKRMRDSLILLKNEPSRAAAVGA